MNIIAINGSSRKDHNTGKVLQSVLDGAASQGAQTEMVHLYDLDYKGCRSCFACKLKGGESYGHCAAQDDLHEVLQKIEKADAMVIGSPMYLNNISGELKCFFERLIFPFLMYDENHTSIFPGKIQTAAIFTMNLNQQFADYLGYEAKFKDVEGQLKIIFGNAEYLVASDTVQFDDYSKYECTCFDGDAKVKRNKEVFPGDCKAAYEMGIRLIERAKAAK